MTITVIAKHDDAGTLIDSEPGWEEDGSMTTYTYKIEIQPLSGGILRKTGTRVAESEQEVREWLDLIGRGNRWAIYVLDIR